MMKKALVLSSLVVAIALSAYVFHRSTRPEDPKPIVPPVAPVIVSLPSGEDSPRNSASEPEVPPTPIARSPFRDTAAKEKDPKSGAPPRVRILGRVIDERGEGVAGVPVMLTTIRTVADGTDLIQNTLTHVDHSRSTDAEGRFAFPPIEVGLEALVSATPERLCQVSRRSAPTAAGDFDLGDLVAKTGGSITGSVRQADGSPAPGAELEAFEVSSDTTASSRGVFMLGSRTNATRSGHSGADGTYRFEGLSPGTWSLVARTTGRPKLILDDIRVVKNETTRDVDLAFRSGRSLEGTVRDPAGNALVGALISVSPVEINVTSPLGFNSQRASAKSEADGRFSVAGLEDADYNISASMPGRMTAGEANIRAGTTVNLVLAAAAVVSGIVRSAVDGAPVTDFTISSDDRPEPGRRPRLLMGKAAAEALGTADEPGLYAALDLQEGRFAFKIQAPGFAAGTTEPVVVKGCDRLTIDVRLAAELSVSGVVIGSDGQPVAGAVVTLQKRSDDATVNVGGSGVRRTAVRRRTVERRDSAVGLDLDDDRTRRATTADDGGFRIGNLSEGDFALSAAHRGSAPSLATPLALVSGRPVSGVELLLRAGGSITGRAFDEDEKPLPGARVTARCEKSEAEDAKNHTGEAVTDAQGRFTMPGLIPGTWKARVVEDQQGGMVFATMTIDGASKDEPGEVAVEVVSGKEAAVELRLPPKGSVFGIVSEAGKPVPGVKVALQTADSFPMGAPTTTTDETGTFVFRRADLGEYQLSVTPKGSALPVERPVSVRGVREHRADIALPTGCIEGRIVEEKDGRPLAGITILVSRSRTGSDPVKRTTGIMVTMSSDGAGDAGIQTIKIGDNDGPTVVTDQDGRYIARFLDEGSYDVGFRGGSLLKETKKAIKVIEGRSTGHIDFSAKRGATIKVTVDAKSENPPFCIATLLREGDAEPSSHEAGSPKKGFIFEGLAPGTYTIEVLVPEQSKGSARVVVEPGSIHPVTVALGPI